MQLNDEIIDVAEEIAMLRVLENPTPNEITDKVSEMVGVSLAHNSMGARLAFAAYNRWDSGPIINMGV